MPPAGLDHLGIHANRSLFLPADKRFRGFPDDFRVIGPFDKPGLEVGQLKGQAVVFQGFLFQAELLGLLLFLRRGNQRVLKICLLEA